MSRSLSRSSSNDSLSSLESVQLGTPPTSPTMSASGIVETPVFGYVDSIQSPEITTCGTVDGVRNGIEEITNDGPIADTFPTTNGVMIFDQASKLWIRGPGDMEYLTPYDYPSPSEDGGLKGTVSSGGAGSADDGGKDNNDKDNKKGKGNGKGNGNGIDGSKANNDDGKGDGTIMTCPQALSWLLNLSQRQAYTIQDQQTIISDQQASISECEGLVKGKFTGGMRRLVGVGGDKIDEGRSAGEKAVANTGYDEAIGTALSDKPKTTWFGTAKSAAGQHMKDEKDNEKEKQKEMQKRKHAANAWDEINRRDF